MSADEFAPQIAGTNTEPLRVEGWVYGGEGVAHTASGKAVSVPFTLPGELIELLPAVAEPAGAAQGAFRILEASPDRVAPVCVHFGTCGGCQYQMAAYPAQLANKVDILRGLLEGAGLRGLPEFQVVGSPEAYGYRNRIRLRVRQAGDGLQLGYNLRGTREFLPVRMCPIAAPLLWRAAQALLQLAATDKEAELWLLAAAEVEFFCTPEGDRVQVTLFCPDKSPRDPATFTRAAEALRSLLPELHGAGVVRVDPRSGRVVDRGLKGGLKGDLERAPDTVAAWGAEGLPYRVEDEMYWVSRGGFFQVNRFLLQTLVDLVCGERSGHLAWDLFAGVGLFSRRLARRFDAVTAVEQSSQASRDLRGALLKLGPQHRAVEGTTLDFLRRAVLQRERPELVVLDPPRAGAGAEACALLARLAPRQIVYLSCDPTTLARDLALLTRSGYRVNSLHLIDLFPQTYHLETLAVLDHAG